VGRTLPKFQNAKAAVEQPHREFVVLCPVQHATTPLPARLIVSGEEAARTDMYRRRNAICQRSGPMVPHVLAMSNQEAFLMLGEDTHRLRAVHSYNTPSCHRDTQPPRARRPGSTVPSGNPSRNQVQRARASSRASLINGACRLRYCTSLSSMIGDKGPAGALAGEITPRHQLETINILARYDMYILRANIAIIPATTRQPH